MTKNDENRIKNCLRSKIGEFCIEKSKIAAIPKCQIPTKMLEKSIRNKKKANMKQNPAIRTSKMVNFEHKWPICIQKMTKTALFWYLGKLTVFHFIENHKSILKIVKISF